MGENKCSTLANFLQDFNSQALQAIVSGIAYKFEENQERITGLEK